MRARARKRKKEIGEKRKRKTNKDGMGGKEEDRKKKT